MRVQFGTISPASNMSRSFTTTAFQRQPHLGKDAVIFGAAGAKAAKDRSKLDTLNGSGFFQQPALGTESKVTYGALLTTIHHLLLTNSANVDELTNLLLLNNLLSTPFGKLVVSATELKLLPEALRILSSHDLLSYSNAAHQHQGPKAPPPDMRIKMRQLGNRAVTEILNAPTIEAQAAAPLKAIDGLSAKHRSTLDLLRTHEFLGTYALGKSVTYGQLLHVISAVSQSQSTTAQSVDVKTVDLRAALLNPPQPGLTKVASENDLKDLPTALSRLQMHELVSYTNFSPPASANNAEGRKIDADMRIRPTGFGQAVVEEIVLANH